MKNLAALILFIIFGASANAQTTVIGNTSPSATNWIKGSLMVDSAVKFTHFATSDTFKYFAPDASGNLTTRRVISSSGVDTSRYALKSDTSTYLTSRYYFKTHIPDTTAIRNDISRINAFYVTQGVSGFGIKANGFKNVGYTGTIGSNPYSSVYFSLDSTDLSTKFHTDSVSRVSIKYADTSTFSATRAYVTISRASDVKYADTLTTIGTIASRNTALVSYTKQGGDTRGVADSIGTKDNNNIVLLANNVAASIIYATGNGILNGVDTMQGLSIVNGTSGTSGNGRLTISNKASGTTQTNKLFAGIGDASDAGLNAAYVGCGSGSSYASGDIGFTLTGSTFGFRNAANISLANSAGTTFLGPQNLTTVSNIIFKIGGTGAVYAPTSGTAIGINVLNTGWNTASGTAVYNHFSCSPTINQTGGTGIIRNLYLNPTLTAVTGAFRNLEMAASSGYNIYASGAATNYFNGNTLVGTSTTDDGNSLQVDGSLSLKTAGGKIKITTGSNASAGTATLSSGTVVVSTTAVSASSIILITAQEAGTLTGTLRVSARTAGTSFTVSSSVGTDNVTFGYLIIN